MNSLTSVMVHVMLLVNQLLLITLKTYLINQDQIKSKATPFLSMQLTTATSVKRMSMLTAPFSKPMQPISFLRAKT